MCWFLVPGVFITVVLDTVCSTDTILYCIWRSLWDGTLCVGLSLWCWILYVALTQSCIAYGDHYLGICCHCTITVVFSRLVCMCKNYPLLCGCFVLTSPSHTDLHMQYKIVSVLHTVSSTTVINTPATKNQYTRCVFYRSQTLALSTT